MSINVVVFNSLMSEVRSMGRYTLGRADCSVGVPVIHPDYDMGGGDMTI